MGGLLGEGVNLKFVSFLTEARFARHKKSGELGGESAISVGQGAVDTPGNGVESLL